MPDDNFEQALIDLGYDSEPLDDYVPTYKIKWITNLNVVAKEISDLTGIEDFYALETLICFQNSMTSLDLSQNEALQSLRCNYNQLNSLVLNEEASFTSIICSENNLAFGSLEAIVAANNYQSITYSPQNSIGEELAITKNAGESYSYDMTVGGENNLYQWYRDDVALPSQTSAILDLTNLSEQDNGIYHCEVTNTMVPDLTLYSYNIALHVGITDQGLTYIPDDNFEQCLINLGCDDEIDDYVPTANINWITSLDVSNSNIADLTGIENFSLLESLSCYSNQLTSLDVSNNTALETLYCTSNQLMSLDVSHNINLTELACNGNQLTSLDLRKNSLLELLNCSGNQLTDLDISQNTALLELRCGNSMLTSLDLSQNTALTRLECDRNQISILDVAQNELLTILSCTRNQLTSLDVSQNTAFTYLFCGYNQLTFESLEPMMDLSIRYFSYYPQASIGNEIYAYKEIGDNYSYKLNVGGEYNQYQWYKDGTALPGQTSATLNLTNLSATDAGKYSCTVTNSLVTRLTLYSRDITLSLVEPVEGLTYVPDDNFEQALIDLGYDDVLDNYVETSNITGVESIFVNGKNISDLTGIEDFSALKNLQCGSNQLTTLDVSQNIALTYLYCLNNQLSSLDLSNNIALEYLNCSNNQLTTLDVSQKAFFETLYCYMNQLESLDVTGSPQLKKISCARNELIDLDVSQNTVLTDLECWSNHLTNLDVSHNTALIYLECSMNHLTNLDISQNIAIETLGCQENLLTTLDVRNLIFLNGLYCIKNQISVMDFSQNQQLSRLNCSFNELTSLDLSQNIALEILGCSSNQISEIDISQNPALIYFYCEDNKLTFESLEPAMSIDDFTYSPQDNVGTSEVIEKYEGEAYSYELVVGGANNQYQWFKDDVAMPTQTSATLNLTNLTTADAGVYTCEVTNTVVTGLTLYSRPITLSVDEFIYVQHFHPVWEGSSGVDQMNINCISAQLNEQDLIYGDEIGIFDSDLCVGYGVVLETIDNAHVLSMIVSRDDGAANGYTPGNDINYKIWDSRSSAEIDVYTASYYDNLYNPVSTPTYEVGVTAYVELSATSMICLTNDFEEGWNIFSVNSSPETMDMLTLFQDLADNGSLVKIQDEQGNSVENMGIFGGWVNNIGDISPTEGYKIKVYADVSLSVCGSPVEYPFAIPLTEGWNIIGFPHQMEVDGMEILQQLIDNGTLAKVQDESGSSIENMGIFGGWVNNIGNFVPGEGYKVKVTTDDVLWIEESYLKSTTILPELVATTHFKTVYEGNGVDHMNINLVELPVNQLSLGDELAVYDGDLCVGSVTILPYHLQKGMISIAASSMDETGINGFTEGNDFTLKLWQSANNTEYVLIPGIESGSPYFKKQESTIVSLGKYFVTGLNEIAGGKAPQIRCYPNPTTGMITIEGLPDNPVDIRLLDVNGRLIQQWKDKSKDVELNISNVAPGNYFIQIPDVMDKAQMIIKK